MKHLLFISLLIYSLNLFSQEKDSIKIVVYDPFNADQTLDTKTDIKHDMNLVKWNIGMLARGTFEIDYERCIGDKFTIEAGVGVTYMDFMYTALFDIDNIGSGNSKYKYGPLFTADLKFYPNSVLGFDGFYISIPVRYRSYLSTQEVSYYIDNTFGNSQEFTKELENNHKHTEFGFVIGSQTGNDWDITFDYYLGIGIGKVVKTSPVNDHNTIPYQETTTSTKPCFYCGMKIGIPF